MYVKKGPYKKYHMLDMQDVKILWDILEDIKKIWWMYMASLGITLSV